ncbi:UNVERIFIED_ORG: hypothetical protein OKW15_004660 [Pseudomonas reinekei]|nr:hypothetical protein [Pseudomonas reinekei]
MDSRAPRLASKHALSLTTIASKLAPTGICSARCNVVPMASSPSSVIILCRSELARDGFKSAAFSL